MQRKFQFLSVMSAPKPAPASLVARIHSDAQAMAVSLIGHKHAYVAAQLGISAGYLSQMLHGKHVPDWLPLPFCALTGTALLTQYRDLTEREQMVNETEAHAIKRMARELAA